MKNLIEFFKCAADKDSIFNNYIHLVTFADGKLRIRTVAHINFHFFSFFIPSESGFAFYLYFHHDFFEYL